MVCRMLMTATAAWLVLRFAPSATTPGHWVLIILAAILVLIVLITFGGNTVMATVARLNSLRVGRFSEVDILECTALISLGLLLVGTLWDRRAIRAGLMAMGRDPGDPVVLVGHSQGGLAVLRLAKTAENATDYSLQNTIRQALFLPTTREEKYNAKQAVQGTAGEVGQVAFHPQAAASALHLVMADGRLRGRVAHVEDLQTAGVVSHVSEVAHKLDVPGNARRNVGA